MPLTALCLALAAATLHAVWNMLLARASDPESATAVASVAAVAAFAPAAALTWRVSWDAVPYAAASAAFELAYFGLLAAAYRRSDLSLVYPLARGLAPVTVLVVAALAAGAAPSPGEIAAICTVAVGILMVRRTAGHQDGRTTFMAVLIAGCIAAYTVIDKAGLHHAAALPYLELTMALAMPAYAVAVARVRGPAALRAQVQAGTLAAGVCMFAAYGLVLAALRLASAPSVAAVRETSVVIVMALAAAVLREQVRPVRWAGAVLVVAGVGALAWV
ncbi:MAG: EamA family transporter [Gaiellales bacterium]